MAYGDGQFVAVNNDRSTYGVMTSLDGITWTPRYAAATEQWHGLAYGTGTFVSIAVFAGFNGVMSSTGTVDPVLDASEWTVVRQAIPLPASGLCADAEDADLAWGTGLSGGWSKGWEPWVRMSPTVDGGWACVRQLVNTGGNRWLVSDTI